MAKKTGVTLAIPDPHFPAHHPDIFPFLLHIKKTYKPDTVVALGDLADQHAASRHPRDPDWYSIGHELDKVIETVQPLYEMFPDVLACIGNHDTRIHDRAFESGTMPKRLLPSFSRVYKSPKGWKWADSHEVYGVIYEHGTGMSGEMGHKKAAMQNMQSTVIGHLHSSPGIAWYFNKKHAVFGMNAGCLIDVKSPAMAYGKHYKAKPGIGCGIVAYGVPSFVPMLLDRHGRWIGK
jgi:hypothetical protein